MAYIIKVDGTIIENCGTSIKELTNIIGGDISKANAKDGNFIIWNAETSKSSSKNQKATDLYIYRIFGNIYGDVVICNSTEVN